MISVERLHKNYGSFAAVRDVSFTVDKGEVVGFLGPNGAGKSTTLRIVAGFLGATAGRVVVDGHDIVDHPIEARARIGYMPENVPLYPELRVREYLAFRAEVKQVPRSERKAAVDKVLKACRIDDHANTIIGHLSKGYRQRVGLADALVSAPPVLVLDEPTSGLDPNQIREVRELIRSLSDNHTVLLSTHILSEVEATCDRALVIDRGRLIAHGSLDELSRSLKSSSTKIVIRGDATKAQAILLDLDAVERVKRASSKPSPDDVVSLTVQWKPIVRVPAEEVEKMVKILVGADLHVREVVQNKASLEEVFAQLTEDDEAPDSHDQEAP